MPRKGHALVDSPVRTPVMREPLLFWMDAVMTWAESRGVQCVMCRDDEGWYAIITVKGVGEVVVPQPVHMKSAARREQILRTLSKNIAKLIANKQAENIRSYTGKVHYGL